MLLLALVAIPFIAGSAGMLMWFIPNPDLMIIEAVAASAYTLFLALLTWLIARANVVERLRQQIGGTNLAIGSFAAFLLIGLWSYFAASVAIPSEFAQFVGKPSDRTLRVTKVYRRGTKVNPFCPYKLRLQGLDGGAGAEFCVDLDLARHLHVGDTIHLHGRATYLGFRVDSYKV